MNKIIAEAVRVLIHEMIGKYLITFSERNDEYHKRAKILYAFEDWLYFEIHQ